MTSSSLRCASRASVRPHGSEIGCAVLFMDELRSLQKALKGQPGTWLFYRTDEKRDTLSTPKSAHWSGFILPANWYKGRLLEAFFMPRKIARIPRHLIL